MEYNKVFGIKVNILNETWTILNETKVAWNTFVNISNEMLNI